MVLFQVLFITILLLELGVGIALKYNYNGLQDKIVNWFLSQDVEGFIRHQFPDRWILQILFILIIFIFSMT